MKKEYITMRLDDLVPYENNPRINEPAVPAVVESIEQVGYVSPIIVDEDNEILAGHTRLKALRQIGEDAVEVLKVTGLSEEQKRKYRLLDNKTNELAVWDTELLALELEDLDFGDFDFEWPDMDIEGGDYTEQEQGEPDSLAERFLVAPFSVLGANKGDWLARKRAWVNRGLRSELGRGGSSSTQCRTTCNGSNRGGYGKTFRNQAGLNRVMTNRRHSQRGQ